MLVHHHRAACQTRSPAHRFDLQAEILEADRVVPVHRTLELQGEDEIQIPAAAGHKRAAPFCGLHLEAAVEFPQVVSCRKRLAASSVWIPRNLSSCGSRPCQVPKLRSLRPRACGE